MVKSDTSNPQSSADENAVLGTTRAAEPDTAEKVRLLAGALMTPKEAISANSAADRYGNPELLFEDLANEAGEPAETVITETPANAASVKSAAGEGTKREEK